MQRKITIESKLDRAKREIRVLKNSVSHLELELKNCHAKSKQITDLWERRKAQFGAMEQFMLQCSHRLYISKIKCNQQIATDILDRLREIFCGSNIESLKDIT